MFQQKLRTEGCHKRYENKLNGYVRSISSFTGLYLGEDLSPRKNCEGSLHLVEDHTNQRKESSFRKLALWGVKKSRGGGGGK